MKIKIKLKQQKGSHIKRWIIETPLGETFQIVNQLEGSYEVYELYGKIVYIAKFDKFEDCFDWIREYTKNRRIENA